MVASANGEDGIRRESVISEPSPNLQGLSAATTTESDAPRSRPVTPSVEDEKPIELSPPPPPPANPSEPAEQDSELSDLSSEESDNEHQKKKTRSSNRRFAKAEAVDKPVKVRPESTSVANSVREGSVVEEQSETSQKRSIHGLYEGGTLGKYVVVRLINAV